MAMQHVDVSEPSVDGDVGTFCRIFARQIDALPLVLSCLGSQRSICTAAMVSRAWREASATALSSVVHLDLRFAATELSDEKLLHLLRRPPSGAWPCLLSVNLAGCALISDSGLQGFGRKLMPTLVDINICCLPLVSADGVGAMCEALESASAAPDNLACSLQSLELSGCTRIRETELVSRFGRFLELADEEEDGLGACQG